MGANTPRLSRISGAPLRYEWAISLSALRNYYCGVIDTDSLLCPICWDRELT